ncbi:MAG TPA: SpoIIE family protein phosphatase [Mycobacteriales bacterium]|nr:SpoIIE family protein phosphatase [Mycobacteriales bacterium]
MRGAPEPRLALIPASFLQAIVEASPDGVLAISPDRRILAVNRRFQQMWGLPDASVRIGGPSPDLTREQRDLIEDPAAFEAGIRWGHDHPNQPQTLVVHLTDGRIIEGYADGIVGDDGSYLGRVWYMHDATARLAGERERAELTERLAAAAREQQFLLSAADALARTSGFSDTLQALAEVAVPTLGDLCLIDIMDDQGKIARMAAVHADPELRPLAARLRAWPPDPNGTHPSVMVMRERTSRLSKDMPADFLAATTRNAEHLMALGALSFRSYMAVPLIAADQVLGSVTFVTAGSRPLFEDADLAVAEDLANRMALVVAKERRYDREREVSHVLQASLLPRHSLDVAGLDVAVRYLAGTRDAEVGGDFWDYATLETGEAAFVIGDVAGHDMVAAAQMAQVRSVCRALQMNGPAELLDAVQRSWHHLGLDRLATAIFARLDPASGRLRLASAGHPPPVVVGSGHAEVLPVEPVPPLGAPSVPAEEWEGILAPGDALVFYTDGLVESSSRDVDDGMRKLVATCASASSNQPESLADRILSTLTSHDRSDDVAILVVRRTADAPTGEPTAAQVLAATSRSRSFAAEPALAAAARRHVVDALVGWGLPDLIEDAALCTTELATNAILHSRSTFTVAVRRTPRGARVDVHDDRPDRLPVVVPTSLGPLDTGVTGRGLMLVAAMAQRWGYFTTDIGKTVWFELSGEEVEAATTPVVELAEPPSVPDTMTVTLIGMPIRPAIASGVQVDELVREIQLHRAEVAAADLEQLFELLERTARPRLLGRQAAFKAAAEGKTSYTLHLATTSDEAAALADLVPLLARLARECDIEGAAVGEDVLAMRAWINSEVAAQGSGSAPTPYAPLGHSDR